MSKNDMKDRVSSISKDDLGDLVKTFRIPLNLHPRLPDPTLCARLIRLREMKEKVLVRSGLKFVWSNRKCDPVFRRKDDNSEISIYDFMTLSSWGDAKVIEEPHHLPAPFLDRLPQHTTAAADEGALIPLPTPDEVVVAQLDPRMASRYQGSANGSFAGKRGFEDTRRCLDPLDTLTRSALFRYAEYDQIPEDDFATASRGEEIDLTSFPLAPGPYVIPYPFESDSSPLYTKQQWDGSHLPKSNILCKEIFKDPDVCRRALDRTITHAELRKTESLLPLELSNRFNVLNALLVLMELKRLQARLADAKVSSAGLTDELARTDAKLSDQAIVCLVRRLFSSDRFHDALPYVASIGISSSVERGLHMGCTDVEFEVAVHNVFNFSVGAEAEFNKALAAFPSILFLFLGEVAASTEGALSEVTKILLDKLVHSATLVFSVPHVISEALDQSHVDHVTDGLPLVV
uniref:Uncharacterized protein n=1 Tax=Tanacetum cinerariifolium TaxID=118510 RepID=A0A6L2MI85_TANCI|nr:hypothetical protein [Tanacetum cinerariifolium]